MPLSTKRTQNHRPMVAVKIIPVYVEIMDLLESVLLHVRMESVESHIVHGQSSTRNLNSKPLNYRLYFQSHMMELDFKCQFYGFERLITVILKST